MLKKATPYLYIIPAFVFFLGIILVPAVATFYLSFYNWSGLGTNIQFIGLENYRAAFREGSYFLLSLRNNVVYLVATLVVELCFGLIIAVILDTKLRFFGMFRVLFFSPMVLSMMPVGLLWRFVFSPDVGIVNGALRVLGLGSLARPWLGDPATALYAVCLASGWRYAGFYMILFYAGLQRIPKHLYESARIDGASDIGCFLHVSLPLLREVIVICVLLCATGAFQAFDIVYAMTGGKPYHSTEVVATWLIDVAFTHNRYGHGSAIAGMMTFIVFVIAFTYLMYTRRREIIEY
jgi:raffinose/stachyose/melibiose transport system permease protein